MKRIISDYDIRVVFLDSVNISDTVSNGLIKTDLAYITGKQPFYGQKYIQMKKMSEHMQRYYLAHALSRFIFRDITGNNDSFCEMCYFMDFQFNSTFEDKFIEALALFLIMPPPIVLANIYSYMPEIIENGKITSFSAHDVECIAGWYSVSDFNVISLFHYLSDLLLEINQQSDKEGDFSKVIPYQKHLR